VGLASGVIPTLLFILLWGLAGMYAFRDKWLAEVDIDALPLVIFAFLEMFQGNLNFMYVWSVTALFLLFSRKTAEVAISPLIKKRSVS